MSTEKKMTLQEAMAQKLAEKKNKQKNGTALNGSTGTKALTSQITKKPNNQKRRTGA